MTCIANDIQAIFSQYSSEEEHKHSSDDYDYFGDSDIEDICTSDDYSTLTDYSLKKTNTLSSNTSSIESYGFPAPKAIFFNTSIDPVSDKEHHIQIYSNNLAFSTILKEDAMVTVGDLIQHLKETRFMQQLIERELQLSNQYNFQINNNNNGNVNVDSETFTTCSRKILDGIKWNIVLIDDSSNFQINLFDNDRIIKIQNKIFRSMWVEEKELPNAILNYTHSFKFVLRKQIIDSSSNSSNNSNNS